MYAFSLRRSSTAATTTVTSARSPTACSTTSRPSGAASRQTAVTSRAPRAEQVVDRGDERAAGREHRVEQEALAARQVVGQAVRVRDRLERLLVALHPEEADLGRRQQAGHAVEHAEARRAGSARRAGAGRPA